MISNKLLKAVYETKVRPSFQKEKEALMDWIHKNLEIDEGLDVAVSICPDAIWIQFLLRVYLDVCYCRDCRPDLHYPETDLEIFRKSALELIREKRQ